MIQPSDNRLEYAADREPGVAILFDQPGDIAAAGSTAGLALDPQGWEQ